VQDDVTTSPSASFFLSVGGFIKKGLLPIGGRAGGAYCKEMHPPWQQVARSGRLERLFQQSFPENPVPELEEEVPPLKCLLEPVEQQKGSPQGPEDGHGTSPRNGSVMSSLGFGRCTVQQCCRVSWAALYRCRPSYIR